MGKIRERIKMNLAAPVMAMILISISIGGFLSGCTHKEENESAVYQELKSVNKMILATMAINKTAVLQDPEWYGDRVAAYTYDNYMQAYLDMSDFQQEDLIFDEEKGSVTVKLPPVEIEMSGRDIELKRVYENVGLLRSDIDAKERAEMKEKANRSFRKEIESNPVFRAELKKSAERKARKYFETVLENAGYSATVEFKN